MSLECLCEVSAQNTQQIIFTACLNCHFWGLRKTRCFSMCPLNANKLLSCTGGGASWAHAQSFTVLPT